MQGLSVSSAFMKAYAGTVWGGVLRGGGCGRGGMSEMMTGKRLGGT